MWEKTFHTFRSVTKMETRRVATKANKTVPSVNMRKLHEERRELEEKTANKQSMAKEREKQKLTCEMSFVGVAEEAEEKWLKSQGYLALSRQERRKEGGGFFVGKLNRKAKRKYRGDFSEITCKIQEK